jgi:hypothetical protein
MAELDMKLAQPETALLPHYYVAGCGRNVNHTLLAVPPTPHHSHDSAASSKSSSSSSTATTNTPAHLINLGNPGSIACHAQTGDLYIIEKRRILRLRTRDFVDTTHTSVAATTSSSPSSSSSETKIASTASTTIIPNRWKFRDHDNYSIASEYATLPMTKKVDRTQLRDLCLPSHRQIVVSHDACMLHRVMPKRMSHTIIPTRLSYHINGVLMGGMMDE